MVSDLTYKIIAFKETPGFFNMNDCVDWALEMMELGYESPNLFILAGLNKPVLYYEAIDYLKAAIKELNLPELEGDNAIVSYACYYIRKLAKGENLRDNLLTINQFCRFSDNNGVIYDFYLLYWAWDDLDHNTEQYYWDGATRENISSIVVNTAKQWLEKNADLCQRLLQVVPLSSSTDK